MIASDNNVAVSTALRQFVRAILTYAKRQAVVSILLMVLTSVSEGIGLTMFLPALQLAGFDLSKQGLPGQYVSTIISALSKLGLGGRVPLTAVLAVVTLMLILRTAFVQLQNVYVAKTVYQFVTRMDVRLYGSIVGAKWGTVKRHRSADFMHLLTVEHERLLWATTYLLTLVAGALSTCLYISLALLLSARLTLVLAFSGALLALALHKRTARAHRVAAQATPETNRLMAEALEHLQNLKAVKTYDAQERDVKTFARLLDKASSILVEVTQQGTSANLWFESGSFLILMAILYFVLAVQYSSLLTVLLLIAVFSRIMPRVASQYSTWQLLVANLPSYSIIEATVDDLAAAAEETAVPNTKLQFRHSIEFEDVSFRFDAAGRQVLDSVSLSIPANKITAIVGSSGSGKSTIADLTIGLLEPDAGRILVDGAALASLKMRPWRSVIGYVAADTVLFHDTVRANLQWANPNASEADMREALTATAAEFVMGMPKGLDTVVGERGMLLSHGERQRIALARALLRNPSLLILDEATNNLDSENEQRVMDSVMRLRGKVTVLMIAHRLSTVRHADLIHVVEQGRVIESGDWNALETRIGGRFRELYQMQAHRSVSAAT